MPILIGLIGLAVAAYFLIMRARNAAMITSELLDVASDVKAAARRFGFRRRGNTHPVESIDDPKLALGGIATAFIALDDLPTIEVRNALNVQVRKHLRVDQKEAQEIAVLGQWFVDVCKGPTPAIARLSKRLFALDKGASFGVLMAVIQDTLSAVDKNLSQRQSEALQDIQRAFHIS